MAASVHSLVPPTSAPSDPVGAAIRDVAAGRMVVVSCATDGYPGVLCASAEHATPDAINFMATEGRGLISLALPPERCDDLRLTLMRPRSDPSQRPAFTVSIEAREGISTGISAADRAQTVRVAVDPEAQPSDLVSPGHVFPIRTHERGVLLRAGHPEAGVDLTRLAGVTPAAVVCAILDDEGELATAPYLRRFCARHGLTLVDVSEIVRHRLRSEAVLERTMDTSMATRHGRFRAVGYVSPFSPRRHMALLKGDVSGDGDVAVHVHEQRSMTDLVGGPLSPDDAPLHKALRQVQADGRGIVVCLGGRDQLHERTALPSEDEAVVAEILADLGVEQR